MPVSLRVHQKADVLRVVVAVHRHHVEAHAAKEFRGGRVGQAQHAHHLEGLLVAVHQRLVVVQVRDAAERGHVQLVHHAFRVAHAVEALGQEVRAPVLLQQATGHHLNPAGPRHQVVGVFDAAIALGVAELLVGHPVELDKAIGEARQPIDLAAAHLAGLRVEGHDRLGPRAARRGAHLQDVQQGFGAVFLLLVGAEGRALVQHVVGHAHQFLHFQGFAARLPFVVCRLELQRAHAAATGVAQAFHGVGAAGRALLGGQPRVQDLLPEAVGQAVGQQARQPAKGLVTHIAEAEHLVAPSRLSQRHHDRRHVQPALRERAVELEGGALLLVVPYHQAHCLTPQVHLGMRYHVLLGLGGSTAGFLRPARLRCFFRYFSCASTSM